MHLNLEHNVWFAEKIRNVYTGIYFVNIFYEGFKKS